MPVLDASLVTAMFHERDAHHPAALRWYEEARRNARPLYAPSLLLAEVAAALTRSADAAETAARAVDLIVAQPLVALVPVAGSLVARAAHICIQQRLKGCDAIYVALAAELDDALITFDNEQLERGGAVARVERPA